MSKLPSSAARLVRTMPAGSPDRPKWLALRRLVEQDAASPEIHDLAATLRQLAAGSELNYIHLAHCMARDLIHYQLDTARVGAEDIAGFTRPSGSAIEALSRGVDDCDAKARLFVALCVARGLRAELCDWWDPADGTLRHLSALVWTDGQWRHIELILSRARVGDSYRDVPTEADGKWAYT